MTSASVRAPNCVLISEPGVGAMYAKAYCNAKGGKMADTKSFLTVILCACLRPLLQNSQGKTLQGLGTTVNKTGVIPL